MLNFSEIMILTMSRTLVRIRQKYCNFEDEIDFELSRNEIDHWISDRENESR